MQFEDGDSEFEKFVKFIQSPIPLQRLVYSKRVAEVIKDGASGDKVAPLLSVVAGDSEHIIRQALAGALPAVLTAAMEKREEGAVILSVMNCLIVLAKDAILEVREAAMQSIIEIAPMLPRDQRESLLLADVLGMIRSSDALDDVAFSEDVKSSALTILNEISPLLGESTTRESVVPQFISLCLDQSFRVRKACAQNIALIAQTVSQEFNIERILPAFLKLAKDPIWSVRKGSIESIVDFTKAVDKNTRKTILIPLMVKFTSDVSRWVRNAAYRALGPFIYECEEDLVTSNLLDLYNGIPTLNSSVVDEEVSFFCAYNFPAVISRLGRERWHEVSQTYEGLCRDTKFKVRKTLAYSLHEVAAILGTEIATNDLLPVFELFLKDLDEVRLGVISSIGNLLQVFDLEARMRYIETLRDIQRESDQNWRFREILANQIDLFPKIYPPNILGVDIAPILLGLIRDHFASVREIAVKKVGAYLNALSESHLYSEFVQELHCLGLSSTFVERQLYAKICEGVSSVISNENFCTDFFPIFASLCRDKVPNVRIILSQIVCRTLSNLGKLTFLFFRRIHLFNLEFLCDNLKFKSILYILKNDSVKDVRDPIVLIPSKKRDFSKKCSNHR